MGKYDDIINLPYKKSLSRKQMSIDDRAAQFAPFAALTGHEDAISETARLTDKKIEIDEEQKLEINNKLMYIAENGFNEMVTIVYFKPDSLKSGGAYVECDGYIKKLKVYERVIEMCSNLIIPIDDISDIRIQSIEKQL